MAYKRKSIVDLLSVDVEVKDENGNPTGMVVTLAGPEHQTRKNFEFAQQRKMRNALQKTGKIELADPLDDELDGIEKLALCSLGWKDYVDDEGKQIPFSPTEAQKAYTDEPWMRKFLLKALNENERFIKSSVAS
jgi:hypothetical protein